MSKTDNELLAAYRLAWRLLSIKQKQNTYNALESLPNWKYCMQLIIDDMKMLDVETDDKHAAT